MKVQPISFKSQQNFCSNSIVKKSFSSKTKDFFEASAVVGLTSIPMFIFIYLYKLYEDTFKK